MARSIADFRAESIPHPPPPSLSLSFSSMSNEPGDASNCSLRPSPPPPVRSNTCSPTPAKFASPRGCFRAELVSPFTGGPGVSRPLVSYVSRPIVCRILIRRRADRSRGRFAILGRAQFSRIAPASAWASLKSNPVNSTEEEGVEGRRRGGERMAVRESRKDPPSVTRRSRRADGLSVEELMFGLWRRVQSRRL